MSTFANKANKFEPGSPGSNESSRSANYEYAVPKAGEDVDFESKFKPVLIDNLRDFEELVEPPGEEPISGRLVAFDTETSTLNHDDPEPIVGFSFSFGAYDGYYVPLRHLPGKNAVETEEIKRVFEILFRFLSRNRVLLYNSSFDLLMLEA